MDLENKVKERAISIMAESKCSDEEMRRFEEEGEETEEESEGWDDWREDDEEDSSISDFLCLFCDTRYNSCISLFEHCRSTHWFDFFGIRRALSLDFYSSFKLINYVRSQVAGNRCWSCKLICQSKEELQNHLHETVNYGDIKPLLDDDRYLKPFMQEDSLLYSFSGDEDGEDDFSTLFEKEELLKDLRNIEEIFIDNEDSGENLDGHTDTSYREGIKDVALTANGNLIKEKSLEKGMANGVVSGIKVGSYDKQMKDKHSRVSSMNFVARDARKVNENYFGSYSSFGIHREMLGDKVRTDAYKQAILENPCVFSGAVVMDVGCGTGILSLFAAQAGASRVISVEASKKMAAVATQIAKDNGRLQDKTMSDSSGVIEVVHCMVEELDKSTFIQPHSIDVIVSEWMGYCLLYESMLNSVLYARDQWLKPGGSILPDTATIFIAGFGKGGTSVPFWENVYGFDMTCVGKELVQDAARIPIVDVIDDCNLLTDPASVQTFDLATMKHNEVDFTANVELEPKLENAVNESNKSKCLSWCYGVVLWFETGFTRRFCKETPVVLSTSPYTPKTHWSQTLLTFQEPIALSVGKQSLDRSGVVGTDACPAARIHLRISIARASEHRSIDISMETTGVGADGRKHSWPAQIFTLS